MSYIFTNTFIFKFIIVFSPFPVLTSWLYTLYKLAVNVIFTILSLIFNYPNLKLTIAVHKGLPIGRSLPCVPCNFYIPIQSSNIARHHFWPIKAWDS